MDTVCLQPRWLFIYVLMLWAMNLLLSIPAVELHSYSPSCVHSEGHNAQEPAWLMRKKAGFMTYLNAFTQQVCFTYIFSHRHLAIVMCYGDG